MTIQTERLRLRPFKIEDANWYFKVTQEKAVRKYLPGAYARSINDSRSFIEQYYLKCDFVHDFCLVMEEKRSRERIGFLDITQGITGMLEVAMLIIPEYRGNGYNYEALNGFAKQVPNKVLRFIIKEDNKPSLKSIQKFKEVIERKDEIKGRLVFVWET